MKLRVLGSAAGGGSPQWNCHCGVCEAVRAGSRASPRTQSSLAIRGAVGPWFLVNASPDVCAQVQGLASESSAVRDGPIADVLLTDAEVDHTAGLLLLRESTTPLRVYGPAGVGQALTAAHPVLTTLDRYCGVQWRTLVPGRAASLARSSLTAEPFSVGGDAPRYMRDGVCEASGLQFRDRSRPGRITYVPALARLDDDVLSRLADSDLVLVDGTFWSDDELTAAGISPQTARQMGHLPLSGPGGTLAVLAQLTRPRRVLVHINNTNPVLLDDSAERRAVIDAGVEVAHDGLEIEL